MDTGFKCLLFLRIRRLMLHFIWILTLSVCTVLYNFRLNVIAAGRLWVRECVHIWWDVGGFEVYFISVPCCLILLGLEGVWETCCRCHYRAASYWEAFNTFPASRSVCCYARKQMNVCLGCMTYRAVQVPGKTSCLSKNLHPDSFFVSQYVKH